MPINTVQDSTLSRVWLIYRVIRLRCSVQNSTKGAGKKKKRYSEYFNIKHVGIMTCYLNTFKGQFKGLCQSWENALRPRKVKNDTGLHSKIETYVGETYYQHDVDKCAWKVMSTRRWVKRLLKAVSGFHPHYSETYKTARPVIIFVADSSKIYWPIVKWHNVPGMQAILSFLNKITAILLHVFSALVCKKKNMDMIWRIICPYSKICLRLITYLLGAVQTSFLCTLKRW